MSETFIFKERAEVGYGYFEVSGSLNETAKFPSFTSVGQPISLDLDKLKKTNSPGLQLWILWLRSLSQQQKIHLLKVPAHFMNSISMVASLTNRNCMIDSFYLPYINTKTQLPSQVLMTLNKDFTSQMIVIKKHIDDLEVDVSPERYLAGLKRLNPGLLISVK